MREGALGHLNPQDLILRITRVGACLGGYLVKNLREPFETGGGLGSNC
jgi:hypothetical protein